MECGSHPAHHQKADSQGGFGAKGRGHTFNNESALPTHITLPFPSRKPLHLLLCCFLAFITYMCNPEQYGLMLPVFKLLIIGIILYTVYCVWLFTFILLGRCTHILRVAVVRSLPCFMVSQCMNVLQLIQWLVGIFSYYTKNISCTCVLESIKFTRQLLKCRPQLSGSSVTWELVRNAGSNLRPPDSNSGGGAQKPSRRFRCELKFKNRCSRLHI